MSDVPETEPTDKLAADDADLAAQVEKWKALSRQNESRWKETSRELDQLKQGQMTEHEKALEAARAEGRQASATEFGRSLIKAEIQLQASAAGVSVQPDFLDFTLFAAEDGTADPEKVKAYINGLPVESEFADLQGAGYHRNPAPSFTSMDPNELADMISGGRFV
ncbi:hypothetical protein P3T27_002109 [Kitasatospora sp. MAA19]|uniref:hypothetical protein n=1 Tax=unclassified Kitasatospora TaxID=2633591 RepID=UPI002473EDF1|nr:hypothetical protein [Kitasatospora sp. MAA19]MDH6705399.1 hypothetical protein [Kitasatospora sp. MAA19]